MKTRFAGLFTVMMAVALLCACGGGGGGGSSSSPSPGPGPGPSPTPTPGPAPSSVVQGTAAKGAAFANATVVAKCADGSTFNTVSSSIGEYSLPIPGSAFPCLIQAVSSQDAIALRSVALSTGTVNVTPLTEMVVARVAKMAAGDAFAGFPASTISVSLTPGNLATAQSDVKTALAGIADLSPIQDLISTPFKAGTASGAGDAIDKAIESLASGLQAKGTNAAAAATAFAQGGTVVALKAAISSGTFVNDVFSKPWTQQQRSGNGGQHLGRLNGDLASFGSGGLMISKDNGATWNEKYINGSTYTITSYNGRLISFSNRFYYRSSPDGGQTWSEYQRLPGIDPKYANYENTADCTFIIGGTLFASGLMADLPVWTSHDGIIFSAATSVERATFNSELAARKIQQNFCRGTYPGPANLLSGVGAFGYDPLAVGSRYFRTSYSNNPAWVFDGTDGTMNYYQRQFNYQLEVSADKIKWQPVSLSPSIAFSYIAEVSPGRFVGLATQEGYKSGETVGMTFLSDGNGGLAWTNVGGIPGPTREQVIALSSLNGVSIIVGVDGIIKASRDDGVSWSQLQSPTTNNLFDAASGAGAFVVVGAKGTILRSTDLGVTWVPQASGVADNLTTVAYGGGQFLATGGPGTVLTSKDGSKWEKTGAGLAAFAPLVGASIAYGAGAFVVASPPNLCVGSNCSTGNSGIFYSGDNGVTWKKSSPAMGIGVTFGNGLFVSKTSEFSQNVIVSADGGKSWRHVGTNLFGAIAYGNGLFVSSGGFWTATGGYSYGVTVSQDLGATWRDIEIPGGIGYHLFFTGKRWVGLGGLGQNRILATSAPQ